MKTWLWRGTPWARWFGPAEPLPSARFQGTDEPAPGHWRASPVPWPPDLGTDPETRDRLRTALASLPPRWSAVVQARDIDQDDAAQVSSALGLTLEEQEDVLAQARAALREALADWAASR